MFIRGATGNYNVTVKVSNSVSSDRLTGVKVDLLQDGNQVGSVTTNLPRCAGILPVSFNVPNLSVGSSYTFTAQVTTIDGNGTDTNIANNKVTFQPITIPVWYNVMIPILIR